jgi:uncharacterized membrane protein
MPVHPMVVHFPLALIIIATCCLTFAALLPRHRHAVALATVGTWNLYFGTLAIFIALGTGFAAVLDLHVGAAAHGAVSMHLKSAVVTVCLILLAAVWRGVAGAHHSRPSWSFTLLLWMATTALLVTGYRGGQNVYRYGIGVAQPIVKLQLTGPVGTNSAL